MQITVKLYGALRTNRFKEQACEYPEDISIQSILDEFEFAEHLLGIILINGVHATVADPLNDGDILSLLPMIDGG